MRLNLKYLLLLIIACTPFRASSQQISPMLVGSNVWYNPNDQVWQLTEDCGVQTLRIGGHAYDDNVPSNTQLKTWVTQIQSMGAQPILQVSQYGTPEQAAALVKFFNIDSATGKPIKYWNIGNEPWLQAGRPPVSTAGALVEVYFKPIAIAMKAIDSTIKIIGPDYCYYIDEGINDLFGGKNDIAGKIPGKSYYYCDGISWHRYPQDGNINLAYEGIEDFKGSIIKCKAKVDEVNASHNRTGDNALIWGIGEYNAKGGAENHTWENGQMFGGVLGLCMKYEATYTTSWSMFESGGNRQGSDFSFIDGNMIPRASYRHMQMIAKNFKGEYVDGISSLEDILVFGSKNGDTVSVMIMNRKADAPASYTLHLNLSDTSENDVQLNVDAGSSIKYSDIISGRATQLLVFKNGEIIKTNYTSIDFDNGTAPSTSEVISASLPPSAPVNLVASTVSYKSILLNWNAIEDDTITGFIIERKIASETEFQSVAIIDFSSTSFIDYSLTDSTSYTYRIQAYNTAGKSEFSSESTDTTYSKPAHKAFNGPHSIPGRIEAENFDDNDEGISYHDSDPSNQGGTYRTEQGVDIEACTDDNGGFNLGYITNGEWLDYSIENITPGTYDIAFRVASNTDGVKKINTYLGDQFLGSVLPQNTAGWQNWETLFIEDVTISGDDSQILKLTMEGGDFNINWIEFGENLKPSSEQNIIFDNVNAIYSKTSKRISVIFEDPQDKAEFFLVGIDGKQFFSDVSINCSEWSKNVSGLSTGIYILIVKTENKLSTFKVIVN
jgi:hypothetical protein